MTDLPSEDRPAPYAPQPDPQLDDLADVQAGDEPADFDDDVDELALLGESTPPPAWVGMVTIAGLGLAVVTALDLIGMIAQGVAVDTDKLSILYKIGLAFAQQLTKGGLGGVALIVALLLVCLPSIGGRTTTDQQDRAAALAIGVSTAFAVVLMVGAVLGVAAQLRILDLSSQDLDSRMQRELATFVIRHVGTGAIALLMGLAALRVRFAPPAAAGLPAEVYPAEA